MAGPADATAPAPGGLHLGADGHRGRFTDTIVDANARRPAERRVRGRSRVHRPLLWRGSLRKIIAGLFISLDGVVEEPADWHFPYFNDEMGAAVNATLGASDIVLFGRKTYDSFAGAWPEREAAGGRTPAWPRRSVTCGSSSCRTSGWSSPGGTPSS